MPSKVADRVKETTNTTGTGDVTLAGAVAQFQSFNAAFGTNVYLYYTLIDANGVGWEVGRGYLSGSTTLVRQYVLASSNSGSAITLSSGTHTVICTISADMMADINGKILAFQNGMNLP